MDFKKSFFSIDNIWPILLILFIISPNFFLLVYGSENKSFSSNHSERYLFPASSLDKHSDKFMEKLLMFSITPPTNSPRSLSNDKLWNDVPGGNVPIEIVLDFCLSSDGQDTAPRIGYVSSEIFGIFVFRCWI